MKENKQEFISLIQELLMIPTEERISEILERLDRISPDPSYADYIYHSEEFNVDDGSFDMQGYVEKVFSYKPILL